MSLQDHKFSIDVIRIKILLSLQKALLGEVTPELKGVTIGWTNSTITGIFYYDCIISDDILEIVEEIETLVMADFPDHHVDFRILEHQDELPDGLNEWVYLRAEQC